MQSYYGNLQNVNPFILIIKTKRILTTNKSTNKKKKKHFFQHLIIKYIFVSKLIKLLKQTINMYPQLNSKKIRKSLRSSI